MKLRLLFGGAIVMLLATSCVDDKYDLANVDTTSRFQVYDLTVPVNIDNIYLSDIIKIEENSKIQVVDINGVEYYALTENGTIDSDPIFIDRFSASAPTLNPSHETLQQIIADNSAKAEGETFTYELVEMGNDFDYEAKDIDNAIVSINSVTIEPLRFTIDLSVSNIDFNEVESVFVTDIHIQMPKGLTAETTDGSYDPATGIWQFDSFEITESNSTVVLKATAIDLLANDIALDNHSLKIDSQFRVLDGLVTIVSKETTLPETLEFTAEYSLNDLVVTNFTGTVNYLLDGMDIADIDLNDIPSFMNGKDVDVTLVNPMIYIQTNNPLADYDLSLSTGLTLTSYRNGESPRDFSLNDGNFTIGYNHGVDGPYNNVLSPSYPSAEYIPQNYAENLQWSEFSSLGSVLAPADGSDEKGLPAMIGVSLTDPQIPLQSVTDFALGEEIQGVKGQYEVLAPFAMTEGSTIVYTETKDNWDVQFLKDMVVTKLTVSADVRNNAPVDIQLFIVPLNSEGRQIDNIEFNSNLVPAQSDGHVTFDLTGEITDLNGVIINAYIVGDKTDVSLSPEQDLVLSEIRAKVSGYYDTK